MIASSLKKADNPALLAAKNARNLTVVRWYLMIYPFGRKGLLVGLDREISRREKNGEPPIEYFAPIYVEAKDVDGKIVRTEKQLFHNYVFVRSSVKELFNMKRYEEQYNFPRRETNSKGEYYYPHVSDEMIENLKWIARSYSGVIPLYVGDTSWLIKGDRIRITKGRLKGVEATVVTRPDSSAKEFMVFIDNWMSVPLLHVKEGEYKVISLNDKASNNTEIKLSDDIIPRLHEILCKHHKSTAGTVDKEYARNIISKYSGIEPSSDIMRCKYYSILLMAHTILGNGENRDNLLGIIHVILPAIKAEQSKALLYTTLYGCTDDSIYYRCAHTIVDEWQRESSPKKSKLSLIQHLSDYDKCLGH